MNSRQKIVQQQFLNDEGKVIKRLNSVYNQALKTTQAAIKAKYESIDALTEQINALPEGDPQRVILESMRQSAVYQKQYQEALNQQVGGILDNLQRNQYTSVADYLEGCYDNGYIGTAYDLHGQGIPLTMPINQQKVTQAVQLQSKISQGLYTRLGEDVAMLQKKITAQVSLAMTTGMSFEQCAERLADYTGIGFNNAIRIARTEGHRVQTTATMDALQDAKDIGADVVKQWDSTLDGKTRPSHRVVDGELRELDEPFSNGLMYPGDPKGSAGEVINCRCALLERARWALDDEELQTLKDRAAFFGLDKTQNFDDFKAKYLNADVPAVDMAARRRERMAARQVHGNIQQSVPTSIDECKTVADVETLLKNNGWFYKTTINGTLFDTATGIQLTGCDLESAKSIYVAHERLFTRFPQLIGKLNSPNAALLANEGAYAQTFYGFGHGGISFNVKFFRNFERLNKSYAHSVKYGFYPMGTTASSIVTHELGHAIDDYLSYAVHAAGVRGSKPIELSTALRPKVMRKCGLTIRDTGKSVSEYATTDAKEWFAECFSEYMDSPDPRPVAVEFGKQLEEYLKDVI